MVTTMHITVTLTGSRVVDVDQRSVHVESALALPAGIEVIRTAQGYLRAGRISDAQQAAVLKLLRPDLTVAAVDASGVVTLDEVLAAERRAIEGENGMVTRCPRAGETVLPAGVNRGGGVSINGDIHVSGGYSSRADAVEEIGNAVVKYMERRGTRLVA